MAASAREVALRGFVVGLCVGVLGGLIGLGGAEFRLPLLITLFGFAALQAVILNKVMSLVVVAVALPARSAAVDAGALWGQVGVIVNLLAGTSVGAWLGATWATRMRTAHLHRVLAGLLVAMAVALAHGHLADVEGLGLPTAIRAGAGVLAGLLIGLVAAIMGVAGGELLIPTLVLLYGLDVRLAGSVSLAVSLPTMLVAFARYRRDGSFAVVRRNRTLVLGMASGSVAGGLSGGLLVGAIPELLLIPALALLLLWSATTVWRHAPDVEPPRADRAAA